MRRRFALVLALALIFSICMPFPVFASVSDSVSSWDFLNVIGSFFSSILNGIGTFIANAVSAILDGLKALFVPPDGFFENAFNKIKNNFNSKFGGILETANYLSNSFKNLKSSRNCVYEILISIMVLILIFILPIADNYPIAKWIMSFFIYYGFYSFLLNVFIMVRRLFQIYLN